MGDKLLDKLINNETSLDLLRFWLCGEAEISDVECSPEEFVTHFLMYLRNASSKFVQTSVVATQPDMTPRRSKITPTTNKSLLNLSRDSNVSVHTSTPRKINKSFSGSETSFNDTKHSIDSKRHATLEAYISGNLFSHSKENTPNQKNRKKKKGRTSTSPTTQTNNTKNLSVDLDSSDAWPEPNRTPNRSRRINPTVLSESSPKTTVVGSNSFTFTQNDTGDISQWQRSVLREEREKIAARGPGEAPQRLRPAKINACLEKVRDCHRLKTIASIHSLLIDLALVPNIPAELHHVISMLLASREPNQTDLDLPPNSVHDFAYLGAAILQSQASLLTRLLNRATLRLLAESERIKEFVPELGAQLSLHCSTPVRTPILDQITERAPFLAETDTREHFPSESSFHAFRKQRDALFEVLRSWEGGHTRPDWSFALSLGAKVRSLVSLHPHPANHAHLARLIKRQLLAVARCSETEPVSESPPPAELDVSSDKLSKLRSRLTRQGGDCAPRGDFPHTQEFYREFITCAGLSNCAFSTHLQDSLSNGILELEAELEAQSTPYLDYLRRSRVLAKFLGYTESLPHRVDTIPSGTVLTSLIAARANHAFPALNAEHRITGALTEGRALVTLPWMVEYFVQLDAVTLRLPNYERVLRLLFKIYFARSPPGSDAALLLLRLCLGRLFESTNFPRHVFYEEMARNCRENNNQVINNSVSYEICVEALYECCPALLGLKTILTTGATPISMRYIRPVTAAIPSPRIKEQKQLEEVFFLGHPESMKRTVEFVSERIASAIIKKIRTVHLETTINNSTESFRDYIKQNHTDNLQQYEAFVSEAMQQAKIIAERELSVMKAICENEAKKTAIERCEESLPALLPEDVHPLTAIACVSLATRRAIDRVSQWMEQSLSTAQIMDPLTKEMSKTQEDIKEKQNAHITQYLTVQKFSVVDVLTQNKTLMFSLHENPDSVTFESLREALLLTGETARTRRDLTSPLRESLSTQVLDLSITLIVRRPDLAEQSLEDFSTCLTQCSVRESRRPAQCPQILNARNVQLLCAARDPEASWDAYRGLLMALMTNNLFTPSAFEEQLLKLFQKSLPERCFHALVDNVRKLMQVCGGGRHELTRAASCLTAFLHDDDFH